MKVIKNSTWSVIKRKVCSPNDILRIYFFFIKMEIRKKKSFRKKNLYPFFLRLRQFQKGCIVQKSRFSIFSPQKEKKKRERRLVHFFFNIINQWGVKNQLPLIATRLMSRSDAILCYPFIVTTVAKEIT